MGVKQNVKRTTLTNIILTLLVLSSIVLSFSLWTTGRNIGEEETDSNQSSPSRISFRTHSFEEVFRPRLIALHGIQDEKPLSIATSYGLNDFLKETIASSQLSKIVQKESLTQEEYVEKITRGKWIEFVYPDELPFGIISSNFSELSKETTNLFFDRILFDQYDSAKVSFYHMESGSFYTAEMIEDEKTKVGSLINQEDIFYQSAEIIYLKDTIKYLPTDPVEIPYQSYIISQFPDRTYINHFFTDTSLVDRRSTNNYTRYIDLTKEVTINENNHTLTYLSQIYTVDEMDPEDRYTKSFQQINQLENWSDSLSFSSINKENNILSFRREINGVPVFSKNEYESISEIAIVEEGVTHIKLPLRFVNTPIDIKGSPKKQLSSGIEMINKLRTEMSEEDFQLIDDFSIGYSWEESNEDSQVVNFEPDWYVYYKDRWLTCSSLIDLHKETVYGF